MAKFEDLLELTRLLTSKNPSKNLFLSYVTNKNSLYATFFKMLSSGEVNNDEQAFEKLYGGEKGKLGSYQKLKTRLYSKLLNSIFFASPSTNEKSVDFGMKYSETFKEYCVVKILLGYYARKGAIHLSEKLIVKTLNYGFTSLSIDLARILTVHYSSLHFNKKKFNKYNQILIEQLESLKLEIKAERYYCELSKNFTNSDEVNPKLISLASKYSQDLQQNLEKTESYKLAIYAYSVIILEKEIKGEYQSVLNWSEKALKYFTPNQLSKSAIFAFKFKAIEAKFRIGDYTSVKKEINNLIINTSENSINWFLLQSKKIIISNYLKDYNESHDIHTSTVSSKYFLSMPPQIQERWRIHEAFLHYLIEIGKLNQRRSRKFRLHKFLNEVPIYSRDKRGANISILIVQLLFLLKKRNYSGILDRLEALSMYHRRYLRRQDIARSNYFIKMLMLIPDSNYDRQRLQHRAQKHLDKLMAIPQKDVTQSLELEIIPYPTLWQYLLESLD